MHSTSVQNRGIISGTGRKNTGTKEKLHSSEGNEDAVSADHSVADDLNTPHAHTHIRIVEHDTACGTTTAVLVRGFAEKESMRDEREKLGDSDRGRYGTMRERLSVSPCAPGAVADPVKRGLSLGPLPPSNPLQPPSLCQCP